MNNLKSMEEFLVENIIPKQPCPKVKCNECGEEVCDSLNYKIGHLYYKHNCKPSVNDYKAKRMLVQYFPPLVKEEFLFAKRRVSFPDKTSGRKYFNVMRITGDDIFLERPWDIDNEREIIEIDREGNIKNHRRGNTRMQSTYNIDETTLRELQRLT